MSSHRTAISTTMGSNEDTKSQGEAKPDKTEGETEAEQTIDRRESSPTFEVIGGRPRILYPTAKKFRPGDPVYIRVAGSATLEGPYRIASATGTGGYTLSLASSTAVALNGCEIPEDQLVAA